MRWRRRRSTPVRGGAGARPGAGRRPEGAYVALATGHEPNRETALSILRHCRENLALFLRVRKLEFYELPTTISGKIRRVELRTREEELAPTGGSPTEFSDTDVPELRS